MLVGTVVSSFLQFPCSLLYLAVSLIGNVNMSYSVNFYAFEELDEIFAHSAAKEWLQNKRVH